MPTPEIIYMGYIVPAAVVIPIAAGLFKYRCCSKPIKIIFYYLLLNGAINILAVLLAGHKINNLPLLHLFTILEFLLLSRFYQSIFTSKWLKKAVGYTMVVFTLLCIVNFTFFQSIRQFNTNTRPLEALLLMGYGLLFSARVANMDVDAKWSSNPHNWANTAILLYFSGALFVFSFSNITSGRITGPKYHALDVLIWNIHATLVLAMYLLFARGIRACKTI